MSDGVQFDGAGTDFPDVVTATQRCRDAAPNSNSYEVVFFYPKGTTNAESDANGSSVTLIQKALPRTSKVTVSALTGRTTRE
jgi:hypothetical protein